MQEQANIVLEKLMSLQNQLQNAYVNGANAKIEFEDLENAIVLIAAAITLIQGYSKPLCKYCYGTGCIDPIGNVHCPACNKNSKYYQGE